MIAVSVSDSAEDCDEGYNGEEKEPEDVFISLHSIGEAAEPEINTDACSSSSSNSESNNANS